MKRDELVESLRRVIAMIKSKDDGFDYGGEIVFFKKREDEEYDIYLEDIEMALRVKACVLADMGDKEFACLMSEVYTQRAIAKLKESEGGEHEKD